MIKKTFFLFFIFSNSGVFSQRLWQINKDTVITWFYQDGDEFNSPNLNTQVWKYWYGWGRSIASQQEQQYYTDGKNHQLSNGYLNLYAKREKINAKLIDWLPETDSIKNGNALDGINKRVFNYSAGMIQSEKKYLYGYFEIKFRMPKDKGFWPAFWLYGGTPNEEIDWMELKTEVPNAIHVGRHSKKEEENKLRKFIFKRWWGDDVYFKGDLTKSYNVVSGEWTPDYLKYYLNGECIAYTKLSMNEEKVLCANIAVPSNNGPFKPGPDTTLKQSGNYEIDYIRIWTTNANETKEFPDNKLNYKINNDSIGISKLKSKTKFLYGKKSIHKNEGIIVSLVPNGNKQYNLQVFGKEIPNTASYTIRDKNNQSISKHMMYGDNIIDLKDFITSELELKMECFGKQVIYNFPKP